MDINKMTREELIEKLETLERQRAFTYEDQMKLAILDKSPLTVWASDRDCKIKLWTGQCQSLYGYSHKEALEKDYVELFVAPDEQLAARQDQLSIINEGAVFHNIANDIGKAGNTLQLLTNCFRIKDIESGDYWNAEIGLIIDYFDQEKEKLALIIDESRNIKMIINQFISNTRQIREHFQNRKKTLLDFIILGERNAIKKGKRKEFGKKVKVVKEALNEIQKSLKSLIDDYNEQLQSCITLNSCYLIKGEFDIKSDELIRKFEKIALDFEEINIEFDGDSSILNLKESLFKERFESTKMLANLTFETLSKNSKDIDDYRRIKDGNQPESSHYTALISKRDKILEIRDGVDELASRILKEIVNSNDSNSLIKIRTEMIEQYSNLEDSLKKEIK